MKVALVHDFLTQLGGAERVLIELVKLFPQAPIYTLFCDRKSLLPEFKKSKIITSFLQKNPEHPPKFYRLLLFLFPTAIESFDFSDFDLVFSDSNSFAKGVIASPKTLHICYIHSPTRYLWDWRVEYLKEHKLNKGIKGFLTKYLLHRLRLWDSLAAHRPNYIIANSKIVSERIRRFYRRKADAIIHPPVETDAAKPSPIPQNGFYLAVARLSPYKKIDLAIRAIGQLGLSLKIIGEGTQAKDLKKLAKRFPASKIEFLGKVDDSTLQKTYQKAKAIIFPCEDDFGIVPIEALAYGRPVIALKKGGATETLKEGKTGFFFPEPDVQLLKEAIVKLEKNLNQFNPRTLHKEALKYDSQNFRKKINQFIDTCLKKSSKF